MTCSLLVEEWCALDPDAHSRSYIQSLHDANQTEQLKALLGSRLAFGTAGLRSEMGPGFARLNPVTVALAGQAFLAYLLSKETPVCGSDFAKPDSEHRLDSAPGPSVVIGYDHRHSSRLFAHILAAIFRSANFCVYLFSKIIPTPLLAFAVKQLETTMGFMVTASHNPRQDNGIKVYQGPHGCQISSPVDAEITAFMQAQERIMPGLDLKSPSTAGTRDPLASMQQAYYDALFERFAFFSACGRTEAEPLAVYTPIHGVGQSYVDGLMARCRLPSLLSVATQREPDPEFPTVAYPNPEEKGAFDASIKTANEAPSVKYILANDPDADRFSIAQKLGSGEWRIFKGDEIGIILAYYLSSKAVAGSSKDASSNCSNTGPLLFMNTVVSSPLIKRIAERHHALYRQTLTGFKYLANEYLLLRKMHPTLRPVLAYEEALGYMISDIVLDKDGISALLVTYQLVLELEAKGQQLADYLEAIYRDVGYAGSSNSYFRATDSAQIPSAFFLLRHGRLPQPNEDLLLKPVPTQAGSPAELPLRLTSRLPPGMQPVKVQDEYPAKMIAYAFANGLSLTLRASGTEPKLKYYAHWVASPAELEKLPAMVDALLESLLQAKTLGLAKA